MNANGKFHFSKLLLRFVAQSSDCGDPPYPKAAAFFAHLLGDEHRGDVGAVEAEPEPFSANRLGPSAH